MGQIVTDLFIEQNTVVHDIMNIWECIDTSDSDQALWISRQLDQLMTKYGGACYGNTTAATPDESVNYVRVKLNV